MILEHIMKNILYYFLPLAVSSTIALLTSEKIRARKKIVFWGNLLLFVFVITFSLLTRPAETPLQAEWAFYALHDKPGGKYELRTLLGEGAPSFLGLEDKLWEIKGVPIVHSGEESQMRLRVNRKGYLYVFHFDSTFAEMRQLFPSKDIQRSNPVPSDSWVELPTGAKTWRFDKNPGLEVFLAYISTKESNDIRERIWGIVEDVRKGSAGRITMLQNLLQRLEALAPSNYTFSGQLRHNLMGVIPQTVKTFAYQAQDGRSALLCQFVKHEP